MLFLGFARIYLCGGETLFPLPLLRGRTIFPQKYEDKVANRAALVRQHIFLPGMNSRPSYLGKYVNIPSPINRDSGLAVARYGAGGKCRFFFSGVLGTRVWKELR